MRSYPVPTYPRVSDGEERTQGETLSSSIRISLPRLPQLRSGRVAIQLPPERGSLPGVWLRAESRCLGNAPADDLSARRPGKPRLRGVRPPRDAPSTGRGIPLSGLQFGGSTRKIRIPRGRWRREQRSSPILRRKSRRSASTEEVQREALAARRKEVSHRKILPASNRACGYAAIALDEGGMKNVYRTR
jgi:hypothetical protein